MTGHRGDSEFWFPEILNVPLGKAEGNIAVESVLIFYDFLIIHTSIP